MKDQEGPSGIQMRQGKPDGLFPSFDIIEAVGHLNDVKGPLHHILPEYGRDDPKGDGIQFTLFKPFLKQMIVLLIGIQGDVRENRDFCAQKPHQCEIEVSGSAPHAQDIQGCPLTQGGDKFVIHPVRAVHSVEICLNTLKHSAYCRSLSKGAFMTGISLVAI